MVKRTAWFLMLATMFILYSVVVVSSLMRVGVCDASVRLRVDVLGSYVTGEQNYTVEVTCGNVTKASNWDNFTVLFDDVECPAEVGFRVNGLIPFEKWVVLNGTEGTEYQVGGLTWGVYYKYGYEVVS